MKRINNNFLHGMSSIFELIPSGGLPTRTAIYPVNDIESLRSDAVKIRRDAEKAEKIIKRQIKQANR